MLLNQTDPVLRRVGPLLALDENGDPVLGEDFSGPGELEISVNGAAYVAAAGAMLEIGDGYYYYQGTVADATAGPWIAIKISGVCAEYTFREDVTETISGILPGETDPDSLRVGPLRFLNEDGDELLEADIAGIVGEVSINGSTWASAAGTFEFIQAGYVYYIAFPTEVMDAGWLAVKISGVCVEFTFREEIVPFGSIGGPPFGTIISIVGSPIKRWTPVVARISISDGLLFVRYDSNSLKFWLYDPAEGFTNNFKERSSVVQLGDEYVLTILPNGGWWTDQFKLKFVAGIELA